MRPTRLRSALLGWPALVILVSCTSQPTSAASGPSSPTSTGIAQTTSTSSIESSDQQLSTTSPSPTPSSTTAAVISTAVTGMEPSSAPAQLPTDPTQPSSIETGVAVESVSSQGVSDAPIGVVAPRLTPDPSDYLSPEASAVQFFAVLCYRPVSGVANQNLTNSAPWLTLAGWQDDESRGVTKGEWAAEVDRGVSRFCVDVTAVQWESATPTVGQATVDIAATAMQVDRDGTTAGTSAVIETRLMRQDPEGRWLVDVKVQAG